MSDFAPLLGAVKHHVAIKLLQLDAIDRADFQAGFTTGAVVGIDNCQLLRHFLARTFFSHGTTLGVPRWESGKNWPTWDVSRDFVKSITILD